MVARKKEEIQAVENLEAPQGFSDLTPELQAILLEAEKLELELLKDFSKISAKITAEIVAYFLLARKTGRGIEEIVEKSSELSEISEDSGDRSLKEMGAGLYGLTEAIVGAEKAGKFLKELGGNPISFGSIFTDVFKVVEVKKA